MTKVQLLLDGESCGEVDWTAAPSTAIKLEKTTRSSLSSLGGGERVLIACGKKQAVVTFSRNQEIFTGNLVDGLRELASLFERKKRLFQLRDIAMH